MTSADKPLVIVYHADCIDGAACAWAVAKAHGADKPDNPDVTYIPYANHTPGDAEKKIYAALRQEAEVYFVDVVPPRPFLDELMTPQPDGSPKAAAIHIMDHHRTAASILEDYKAPDATGVQPQLDILIDPARGSAARMVWEKLLPAEPVPPVLNVIDKMDGDARGLHTPKDFAAAAVIDKQDISTPERALRTLKGLARLTFNDMAADGRRIVEDQAAKIDKALENASIIDMQIAPGQPPVPVAIVNMDVKQFGRQVSERLIAAGKKAGSGVALAWHVQQNGAVSMSIRTDGDPDASKIADHLKETMGITGGGHEGASAVHFASLFHFAHCVPLDGKPLNAKPLRFPPPKAKPDRQDHPPI